MSFLCPINGCHCDAEPADQSGIFVDEPNFETLVSFEFSALSGTVNEFTEFKEL